MWFRNPFNKRNAKKDLVLDVKVSSDKTRSARLRILLSALSVSAAVLVTFASLWAAGQWVVRRMAFESDDFTLRTFDVSTDGIIPLEQLRVWAGIKTGDNLLNVDLSTIKRNLELIPLIKDASVERLFPKTLKLRITEREPIVQTRVLAPKAGNTYDIAVFCLDEEGAVMPSLGQALSGAVPGFSPDLLPFITGLNQAELYPGNRIQSPQVDAALRLIIMFNDSPMAGVADIASIDVADPEVMLVTTGQGAEAILGIDNLEAQLRRWRLVCAHAARIGKSVAGIDLSVTNNLPVKWAEVAGAPPAPPKTRKPSHYRKKHV
jgi:cell division protein FtsQ